MVAERNTCKKLGRPRRSPDLLLLQGLLQLLQYFEVVRWRNRQVFRQTAFRCLLYCHFFCRLCVVVVQAVLVQSFHLIRYGVALDRGSVKYAALALRIVHLFVVGTSIKLLITFKVLDLNFTIGVILITSLRLSWRAENILKYGLIIFAEAHSNEVLLRKLATLLNLFKTVFQFHLLLVGLFPNNGPCHL